ncbi:MAG: TonB-dependent receptor [Microscillaceae bacterium]|nr:TonB-dependent receptor [Microscillaceae bacterium]
MKQSLLQIFFILLTINLLHAQTGTIRGKVIDQNTREALISATVLLEGTGKGTVTDLDGNFSLKIPSGTYTLKISYVSYTSKTIQNVQVEEGKITNLNNIVLSVDNQQLGEIVISAEALKNEEIETEVTMITKRKNSAGLIDGITAERIKQAGDVNVGSVLRRVTGLSSEEGGRYVYVRGIGDRYTNTLLNGLQIPSLDPDRNTVQLDLIPAQLLSNIVISKSFTPDLPGTSTGGTIDITTANFPEEFSVSASFQLGYNTLASFNNNFITYKGGNLDWLGMDDGTRAIPDVIANDLAEVEPGVPVVESRDLDPVVLAINSDAARLNRIREQTEAFSTEFDPIRDSKFLNHRFNFSIGNQTDLGKVKWGYQASLAYIRENNFVENGRQSIYFLAESFPFPIPDSVPASQRPQAEFEYIYDKGEENVLWGGVATTSVKFGKHKLGATFLYNQSGQSTTYLLAGENRSESLGDYNENSSLLYEERNLKSYQFFGEHALGNTGNLEINWSGAYSQSKIDQPDWRLFGFFNRERSVIEEFFRTGVRPPIQNVNALASEGFRPIHFFRNLEEDNTNLKLDLTYKFKPGKIEGGKLKAGGFYLRKVRDFRENAFTYNYVLDTFSISRQTFLDQIFLPVLDPNTEIGNGFLPGVYIVDGYEPLNNYNADQDTYAAYLMGDFKIWRKLRVVAGARYEINRIHFTSDAFDDAASVSIIPSVAELNDKLVLDNADILPSINITYDLNEQFDLRLAYNRTIAIPTFREKSPFRNFNFIGGPVSTGNPGLRRALVDNYDIRLDYYPRKGNELYSVSIFYKDFTDVIERFYVNDGSGRLGAVLVVPVNVPEGIVLGVELEARKNFDFIAPALKNLSGGANFSYLYSQAKGRAVYQLGLLPSVVLVERRLLGQPTYTLNAFLNYTSENKKLEVNLNFNVQGEFLSLIAADPEEVTDPDGNLIDQVKLRNGFTQPRPDLSFNIQYLFAKHYTVRFSANNLINPDYAIQYDGTEFFNDKYKLGRTFAIGFTYRL